MQLLPELLHIEQTSSTNDYLADLWRLPANRLPFLTVVADYQSAGRGRLLRQWTAPAGSSMLASILVPLPRHEVTLLPLLAGALVAELLASALPTHSVTVKWPNDVHVDGLKIAGILCEYLGESPVQNADETAEAWVALGIGINLSQDLTSLPTTRSTSVALQGGPTLDPLLLSTACAASVQNAMDYELPERLGLITSKCETLGQEVTVRLPGDRIISGTAVDLQQDGALIVVDADRHSHIVRAGDVCHLGETRTFPSQSTPISLGVSQ